MGARVNGSAGEWGAGEATKLSFDFSLDKVTSD